MRFGRQLDAAEIQPDIVAEHLVVVAGHVDHAGAALAPSSARSGRRRCGAAASTSPCAAASRRRCRRPGRAFRTRSTSGSRAAARRCTRGVPRCVSEIHTVRKASRFGPARNGSAPRTMAPWLAVRRWSRGSPAASAFPQCHAGPPSLNRLYLRGELGRDEFETNS